MLLTAVIVHRAGQRHHVAARTMAVMYVAQATIAHRLASAGRTGPENERESMLSRFLGYLGQQSGRDVHTPLGLPPSTHGD